MTSLPATVLQAAMPAYLNGAYDILETTERLRVYVETAPVPPNLDHPHLHVLDCVRSQPFDRVPTEVQLVVSLVYLLEDRDLVQINIDAVDLVSRETVAAVCGTAVGE